MAHKPSSDTFHDPENDVPTCNLMHSKYNKGYIAIKIHSMENDPEKYKKALGYPVINLLK